MIQFNFRELHWQWGKDPIQIHPHFKESMYGGAYYTRKGKALKFYFFYKDQERTQVIHDACHEKIDLFVSGHFWVKLQSENLFDQAARPWRL